MARQIIKEDQVELEIQRLQSSDAVKLAYKYEGYKNRRRNYMYTLRQKEKLGMKLMEAGVTMEDLEELIQKEGNPDEIL